MSEEIGKLIGKCKLNVQWVVDTQSLPEGRDLEYTSSVFSLSDSCWCLGISSYNKHGIGIFLRREDWGPKKTVEFCINFDNRIYNRHFTTCSFLKNEKQEFVRKCSDRAGFPNTVTITCDLKDETRQKGSLFKRIWNASRSLRKILAEGKRSDLVLKVKDREIPAHKMILESRCNFFERMSASGMRESRTGVVNVEEAEEEIFRIVLSYLYSGEPEGLSPENVVEVYKAAHKYDLQELSDLCTTFMENDLNVANVCDVIVVADFYGNADLKECALKFFAENTSKIKEMQEWKSFKSENSALCLEVLDYMM